MPSLSKIPKNLIYTGKGKERTQIFINNNNDLLDSSILAESREVIVTEVIDPNDNSYTNKSPLDIEFPTGNAKTTRASNG